MAERMAALGGVIAETITVAHETEAVRAAIATMHEHGRDPILVFAASAIVDRGDVIPEAVEAAGGKLVHLGMPVDPGNLLLMGRLGNADVIGVPSCAGSPKLNGFDWVLERRLAGLPVGPAEISAMGVGGLLNEIATRPQPREENDETASRREPAIACVVLAAGRSTRMGREQAARGSGRQAHHPPRGRDGARKSRAARRRRDRPPGRAGRGGNLRASTSPWSAIPTSPKAWRASLTHGARRCSRAGSMA